MKVSLYKEIGGTFAALIQASPGKGKAPVVLRGLTRGDLKAKVLPAVTAMREPKNPKPSTL